LRHRVAYKLVNHARVSSVVNYRVWC